MDVIYGKPLARGNISLRKGSATDANIVILIKTCSTSSLLAVWQMSLTMLRSRLLYSARVILPLLKCPLMCEKHLV